MSLLRAPRLLPVTIAAIAGLLGVKSAGLIRQAAAKGGTQQVAAAPQAPVPAPALPKSANPSLPAPAPGDAPPARDQDDSAREAALRERQSMLAAAEQKLAQRVAELKALQSRLEQLQASGSQKQEQDWAGLVQLYERMKPREAARILEGMETPIAVPLIARMKESRAAPILAAMRPDRAREITSELAARHPDPNAASAADKQEETRQ